MLRRRYTGVSRARSEAQLAFWSALTFGSLLTSFMTTRPVRDFASATSANTNDYAAFFRGMIVRGIYPPPSQFEAWFLSAAHTTKDIDKTIAAARAAFRDLRKSEA